MKVKKFKNGLTLLVEERPSDSVAIEVSVGVGSKDETKKQAGLSHFLEHLLFEGTKNRTAQQLSNEIESLGGDFNAATSQERTHFYVHLPKEYFIRGIKILADMMVNPRFDEKSIEKEKNVVINEIRVVDDDPKQYQWVMLLKHLFRGLPFSNPTYGNEQAIRAMTKQDVASFFQQYYTAPNISISIAGNIQVTKAIAVVKKEFAALQTHNVKRRTTYPVPAPRQKRVLIKRNVEHSYLVMGFPASPFNHKDAAALEVLRTILGRGQSSRLFNEIRTKRGIAYIVGALYEAEAHYGLFAAYVGTEPKDLPEARHILIDQLSLKNLTARELVDAKRSVIGSYLLANEDNKMRADNNAFLYELGMTRKQFLRNIRHVTLEEMKKLVKKYCTNKYTEILIQKR